MTFLWPLCIAWVMAAVVGLLDGRRRWVGVLAASVLASVLALDVASLACACAPDARQVVTGGWPEGIGIRLRVDALSAIFATLSSLVLFSVMLHELFGEVESRAFPALVLFLCAGLHGVFFTGDAFNFYVFFELSMVASFVLAGYGLGRAELRATFLFVVVNLFGSVVFLGGVASLYHVTGTLDFVQVGARSPAKTGPYLLLPAALFFVAFGLKLGLFPFHLWVPVVYRDTRPAVAAALAGALANIGSYGLLRFGHEALARELALASPLLVWFGAASALYGTVLAFGRRSFREAIAYASIAQAGYLFVALGVTERVGVYAVVFLAIAGGIDKSVAILATDVPGRAGRFASAIAAMSIAGLPLTLGFVSKLALLRAALGAGRHSWALVAVLVAASALTIAFMFRRWLSGAHERAGAEPSPLRSGVVVSLAIALVVLAAGAFGIDELVEAAAVEVSAT